MLTHAARVAALGVTMIGGCMPEGSLPGVPPYVYGFEGDSVSLQLSTVADDANDFALVAYDANTGDGDWLQVPLRAGVSSSAFLIHEPGDGGRWGMGRLVAVPKRPLPEARHVVMMGDSITANGIMADRLREHLGPLGATVANHAISGYTWQGYADNANGIAAVDAAIAENPDVVTWMLGTNGLFTAYAGFFEPYLAAEMDAAERLFARFPSHVVHVVAPPPPGASHASAYTGYDAFAVPGNEGVNTVQRWRTRTHETAKAYSAAWGSRSDVLLVPTHLSIHRADHYSTNDAVHPGAAGLESMADAMAAAVLHALQ